MVTNCYTGIRSTFVSRLACSIIKSGFAFGNFGGLRAIINIENDLVATLTETAYYSRRIIKFGSIGLAVFLVARFLVLTGIAYYKKLNPPPAPPPTVAFGVLPKLVFGEEKQPELNYRLETVSGVTPDLGDKATVYFMPVRQANLLALERMTDLAKKLDFDGAPEQLSAKNYVWRRDNPIPATLTADIVSGSFVVKVSWQQDPTILSALNLPNAQEAIVEGQRFLQSAGIFAEDLLLGKAEVSFYKSDVNEFVEAVSLSEAEFVRVDFFRNDIDELKVYTPNLKSGVVSLIFSGAKITGKRVVELFYNYFPVSYEQSETYPVKTSRTAWEELMSGAGHVANVDKLVTNVVVRKVSMGYFDSVVPQHYMQPVYVFEGDGNFVGYVPAVSKDWVE